MIEKFKQKALKIPSMGGRQLGPVYDKYIAEMDDGLNIVEAGAWLGAGTAQILISMYERKKLNSILYVFDGFQANASEIKKAKRYGVKLKSGQNTLPLVKRFLHPMTEWIEVKFRRARIMGMEYNGGPIGILVLDMGKKEEYFKHLMSMFEHKLVDGAVVFFMDYYYYLHKDDKSLMCQKNIIEESGHYEELEKFEGLSCSVRRYHA